MSPHGLLRCSLFKGANDNAPKAWSGNWADLVALFLRDYAPAPGLEGDAAKKSLPALCAASFQPGSKRSLATVEAVHLLLMDFDNAREEVIPGAFYLDRNGLPSNRPRMRKVPLAAPVRMDEVLEAIGAVGYAAFAWTIVREFSSDMNLEATPELDALGNRLLNGLHRIANDQLEHLESSDPADRFRSFMIEVLQGGRGYLLNAGLGEVPTEWRLSIGLPEIGEPRGRLMGYLDLKKREVWLIPAVAYAEANRLARDGFSNLGNSDRALWKRLQEKGWLVLQAKDRNTAKRTPKGGQRAEFLVLKLDDLFQIDGTNGTSGAETGAMGLEEVLEIALPSGNRDRDNGSNHGDCPEDPPPPATQEDHRDRIQPLRTGSATNVPNVPHSTPTPGDFQEPDEKWGVA